MVGNIEYGEGSFHQTFRLSITKALGDQLADSLAAVERVPLRPDLISQVGRRSGVYQLYLADEFVYVGKANGDLRGRLTQHHTKLFGRTGIDMDEMTFSCLYVMEDFSALAPERLLIDRYREAGQIPWNVSGFGNKDPGRNRDMTRVKAMHFDARYPINLDFAVDGLPVGPVVPAEYMLALKNWLPFTFRFDDAVEGLEGEFLAEPVATADQAFELLSAALPAPWQIVALPGYVVAYPNDTTYPSAIRVYRSGHSERHQPELDNGKLDDE